MLCSYVRKLLWQNINPSPLRQQGQLLLWTTYIINYIYQEQSFFYTPKYASLLEEQSAVSLDLLLV